MHGLLLVNKPKGYSSRSCVHGLKNIPAIEKLGHVGTLDVEASGLLMVLLNRACRLQKHLLHYDKRYTGVIRLGASSATDDAASEIEYDSSFELKISDSEAIDLIYSRFNTAYCQKPPLFSAKKVEGKTAYKEARKGKLIDLASVEVKIKILRLAFISNNELEYDIEVGSGFYVRSFARDIGNLFGTGGIAVSIHRESIGEYSLDDAISLSDDSMQFNDTEIRSQLLDLPTILSKLPYNKLDIGLDEKHAFLSGNKDLLLDLHSAITKSNSEYVTVFDSGKNPLGILRREGDNYIYDITFQGISENL